MKNAKQEKTCENCRYFSHHYAKDNTSYHTVCCGHCLNRELDKKENKNKKRPYNVACEFWETIAIKKEERKEAIKDTLQRMAQRIDEIAMILKDDEDNNEKDI